MLLIFTGCVVYNNSVDTDELRLGRFSPIQFTNVVFIDPEKKCDYECEEKIYERQQPPVESIRIGVTHAKHDDVGRILMFFGGGVEFSVLAHEDLKDLERLSEFYAIFINCGSCADINPRILKSYVAQGGIVYASDLVSSILASAFPEMFEYENISPSMKVYANIPHTSLASHMRQDRLNVIFNMGGWNVITELSEDATVYIQGYVPNHGYAPLAMSFNYGEGTVFYTSFHNNAQATSSMVNFIEYLIFRIKFIEADRGLSERATREGFIYRGAVFGLLGDSISLGAAMSQAEAALGTADSLESLDWSSLDIENFAAPEATGAAALMPRTPSTAQRIFTYTFNQNEDFMLMVETDVKNFTLKLKDPSGNTFLLSERGKLISKEHTGITPLPIFENINNYYGVLVRNVTGGEWHFEIIAEDAADNAVFMVGIATRSL